MPARKPALMAREDSFEGQTQLIPSATTNVLMNDAALRAAFGPSPIFGAVAPGPAHAPARPTMPSPTYQTSDEIVADLEALKVSWINNTSLNIEDLLKQVPSDYIPAPPPTTPIASPVPSPPFDSSPWSKPPTTYKWGPTPSEAYSDA